MLAHLGHSHAKTAPVTRPYSRPSNTDFNVVAQLRRYQMECCGSASAYAMNATVLTTRNTIMKSAPGRNTTPATYPTKTPMTTQYANQRARYGPIDGGAPGAIVMNASGPFVALA